MKTILTISLLILTFSLTATDYVITYVAKVRVCSPYYPDTDTIKAVFHSREAANSYYFNAMVAEGRGYIYDLKMVIENDTLKR